MYYTSMIPPHLHSSMKELLLENAQKYQENMYIGLGTIIQGIHGNEPILSPKNLDKDLNFLKQNNIKNAVIFRLGGLNKNYMKVIRKYT